MNWLPAKHERPCCGSHTLWGNKLDAQLMARRWFLEQCGVGLGAIALRTLWGESAYNTAMAANIDSGPLMPGPSHRAPRAKNVIYLFMAGAPSHLELFDFKPQLAKFDGSLPPDELIQGYRTAFIQPNSKLLGPKVHFFRRVQCGTEISEVLPHLAKVADDIAVVKSLATEAINHAPAQIFMNTGFEQFGRPCLGSWVTYGLGSESRDLPGFVVINSGKRGPSGGSANWGSGFLPTVHQAVPLRTTGDPVLYLSNPRGVDDLLQRETVETLRRLNQVQLRKTGDPEIATRINSFEMAFRMQSSAPELFQVADEPQHILDSYGVDPDSPSFAHNCLLARRLVERGVRFVQLFHEAWDQHSRLVGDLKANCQDTDRAAAALIQDLKQRGMLDDTLVIWGGEFGRTPMVQGDGGDGRDHHSNAFSIWMAGGGIKSGITVGETDDFGFDVIRDRVHVHDLNATILHCLGLDHERLTFRVQGRDFRLTDVHGNVVKKVRA